MTELEFSELKRGDIIRHKSGLVSSLVTASYGKRVTAVQTIDVTNPAEWDLTLKATYKHENTRS